MKHKGNQMLAGIFLLLLSAIAVVFSIGFAMLLAEEAGLFPLCWAVIKSTLSR